jgi:hypothetical protein
MSTMTTMLEVTFTQVVAWPINQKTPLLWHIPLASIPVRTERAALERLFPEQMVRKVGF